LKVPRNFDRFFECWRSLAAGATPESSLFDPVPVLDLMPHLIFVDIEDNPFRVRFRHSGTRYEDIACVDITGRYLDEFAAPATQSAIDILAEHYRQCRENGQPAFGGFTWPDDHGHMLPVQFAIFPFTVHGIVRQCIALEDYGTANGAINSSLLHLPPAAPLPAEQQAMVPSIVAEPSLRRSQQLGTMPSGSSR
jgi:hypothetical protein